MHPVTDVYHSRELLWNLTLRELRTKYRRSFLGWAWSMLNPLSQIIIYGFVFGTLLGGTAPIGVPSGLDNFALWLLCGLLPWNFFSLVTALGLGAISANAGLVRRVAFPREVLVFSNVLHACVQFSIEMSLLFIVLLIAGSPFLIWLPLVVLTSVLLAMFATGIALALSVLAVYFRDVSYLWAILIQVWFFATPIVYLAVAPRGGGTDVGVQHPQAQPDERFRRGLPPAALRRRRPRVANHGRFGRHLVRQPRDRLVDLPPHEPPTS